MFEWLPAIDSRNKGASTLKDVANATGVSLGTASRGLAGVIIFGFLGNILLLNDIDSNTQLVLKGLIIVIAVFLQQTDFGRGGWLKRLTRRRRE
ncbi:hypothetical protein [Paraburkholderia sp. HP33-1]|uniref:hypothetical protein n=1 Tax=Paraburkholderia sp. HP33-1 TaxID=2883243 RepID=UPI001F15EAF0|nr:hypothetical protein [Paraburkholderia sp. HP33-1]